MAEKPYKRRHERFRVHLAVRFASADDFVQEYAENLSIGGLFITGATNLQLMQEVTTDIDLPGAGNFTVRARVAHLISPELAAASGKRAGVGLEIIQEPIGFSEALAGYLQRLGQRKDNRILSDDDLMLGAFAAAGYQTGVCPEPGKVAPALANSDQRVIALVVSSERIADYIRKEPALHFRPFDNVGDMERMLPAIDALLS